MVVDRKAARNCDMATELLWKQVWGGQAPLPLATSEVVSAHPGGLTQPSWPLPLLQPLIPRHLLLCGTRQDRGPSRAIPLLSCGVLPPPGVKIQPSFLGLSRGLLPWGALLQVGQQDPATWPPWGGGTQGQG